jgi:uncharacterized protein YerC
MPDPTMEREMIDIRAQLNSMETTRRWIVDVGDINELESENEAGAREKVVAMMLQKNIYLELLQE